MSSFSNIYVSDGVKKDKSYQKYAGKQEKEGTRTEKEV